MGLYLEHIMYHLTKGQSQTVNERWESKSKF